MSSARESRLDQFWRHMLSALSCIAALLGLEAFVFEVNLSGLFSKAVDTTGTESADDISLPGGEPDERPADEP